MSALPDELTLDYLVYSVSESLQDEIRLWDEEYYQLVKRMFMKMFDSWIERKYKKNG